MTTPADTLDLRTVELRALCSDGAIRRLALPDATKQTLVALLCRIFDGTVHHQRLNLTVEKPIVIKPGVRMDDANEAVSGFLDTVAKAEKGRHEGPRNGIVVRCDDRYCYVYQTVTQIVVMQG